MIEKVQKLSHFTTVFSSAIFSPIRMLDSLPGPSVHVESIRVCAKLCKLAFSTCRLPLCRTRWPPTLILPFRGFSHRTQGVSTLMRTFRGLLCRTIFLSTLIHKFRGLLCRTTPLVRGDEEHLKTIETFITM